MQIHGELRRAALAGALIAMIALLPRAASAEQGAVRQIPASQISITRLYLTDGPVGTSGECVFFINTAPATATRVLFLYQMLDENGKLVHTDTHEAKGQFGTGTLIRSMNATTCGVASVYVGDGRSWYEQTTVSVIASVAQVDYADGTVWHAGPDILGATFAQPDADVRITKTLSWQPGGQTEECVAFTNAGTRMVRHVKFMFSHIADDGSDVVDDPLDVRTSYQPGASQPMACRGWNGSATPASGAVLTSAPPQILVFGKPARLVSWIDEIDYADGTSWHASALQSSAITAAAIPPKADFSLAVWWPQSPDIAGSFAQQSASGIEITKAFTWNPGLPNECVNFVSHSARPVTHVRFLFSHFGVDGATLGQESLDIRPRGTAYETGAAKAMSCRTFEGMVTLPAQWNGGSNDAQVLFGQQPSTLTARVDEVDYAGGTSWSASAASGS